jgi:hypothetical protein
MKSIFLIFALTTSFSPLMLSSGPNPKAIARIAAALEAAAAEREDKEMVCPTCQVKRVDKVTCYFCGEELISKKTMAELKAAAKMHEEETAKTIMITSSIREKSAYANEALQALEEIAYHAAAIKRIIEWREQGITTKELGAQAAAAEAVKAKKLLVF